jgi:hypothetical protein
MLDNRTKWRFIVAKNDLFFDMKKRIESPPFQETLKYSKFYNKANTRFIVPRYHLVFDMNNGKVFHDYLGTLRSHGLDYGVKGCFMDNGRVLYNYQETLKSHRLDHRAMDTLL